MRPRNVARPAAAGALAFAINCAGAEIALAETESTTSMKPRIEVNHRDLNLRSGKRATVFGRVSPARPGLKVGLQVKRGRGWKGIEGDRTDARGRYRLRQRLGGTLSREVRVRVKPAPGVARAERKVGRLNVFRYAHASWYGPGLYGNPLGCGGTLYPGRLGVAHKTLPCGSKVTLRRGSRQVRVRVIDRGPYVGGREYDLTEATAQRLRFRGHGPLLVTR